MAHQATEKVEGMENVGRSTAWRSGDVKQIRGSALKHETAEMFWQRSMVSRRPAGIQSTKAYETFRNSINMCSCTAQLELKYKLRPSKGVGKEEGRQMLHFCMSEAI